jgi:hypothetical protein
MKSDTKRGEETQEPVYVIYYNKWMDGFDLKDQLLQMYLAVKMYIHKRYMKLFGTLLNAAVLEHNDNL